MKKSVKTILVASCVATICAGAATAVACSGNATATGEAYGLVHGAGYIGYASVTVSGDKVTAATLQEVCLPTYVEAGESVPADDKVTVKVMSHGKEQDKTFYKSVSYGDVTLTYDAEKKDYMNGSTTFMSMMGTEANAKAYFEAVMANKVSVTVGGEKKTDVLNKKALSKDENNYWGTTTDKDGNAYSRWKMNRDATVKYVIDNGVDKLLSLKLSDTKAPDAKEDKEVTYWTDGTVVTGATWTDLNTKKEGTLSYAQLIMNAYNAKK